MKYRSRQIERRMGAFTLVELFVVMSVIAVLTVFTLSAVRDVKKARAIKLAQTELTQVQSAIDTYRQDRGYYPPDNPGNPALNQLFFELKGSCLTNVNNQPAYVTLDGSGQINVSDLALVFGPAVKGFMNLPRVGRKSDEDSTAVAYLRPNPGQSGRLVINGQPGEAILVCSVRWTDDPNLQIITTRPASNPHAAEAGLNPWQYNSSHPQRNPNSYDLWVDVYFNGKTNRISNWVSQPQVL